MKIEDFITELMSFAANAEATLDKIASNPDEQKNLLSVFSKRMIAIRGTAQQLGLPNIARFASLGEEISIKGAESESRAHVRKCVGCLWDALTTIKYLLVHHTEETNEEQQILIHRLENTLKALGGSRASLNQDEIEKLLK